VPVLKKNGTVREWIGTCTDITEQKLAEEARAATERQLKASLGEKDILLKEVHHRVKNNLQLISSLLRLQSDKINDKKALDMLRESQDRIRTLAMIHEKLYRSESLASIDIAQCIRDLCSHLLSLYNSVDNHVKVQVSVDDISFGLEMAVPCGLVINELVSNALKHAFQVNRKGMNIIDITLRSYRGKYRLVVSDNGIGFPCRLNFRKTSSLGLQLVVSLVKQMGGRISVQCEKGTKISITFGEPKLKDSGVNT
jgi:two-component sensor histidine kinase